MLSNRQLVALARPTSEAAFILNTTKGNVRIIRMRAQRILERAGLRAPDRVRQHTIRPQSLPGNA